MGKGSAAQDKDIEKFLNLGIPMIWRDFLFFMTRRFGFEMDKGTKSSARAFTNDNVTITVHEPHRRGEKIVPRADRRRVIRKLRNLKIIEEE